MDDDIRYDLGSDAAAIASMLSDLSELRTGIVTNHHLLSAAYLLGYKAGVQRALGMVADIDAEGDDDAA